MNRYLHITVKGLVQGVSFRFYTQKQAIKLHVQGFVRNLGNGDVEIHAQGTPEALQQFLDWCSQGSPRAKVSEVIVNEHPSSAEFSGFEIR